ncbi:MAG: four helix bundle protein [Verrucomicrobia bacterium]|nr:four helix bundle protein [Verrucomicrobiota bacterium]
MEKIEKLKITRHTELDVYKMSFSAAMKIFEFSKHFPAEEKYSLTDQVRRSSRSVCANQAEAWRKRLYKAHFASKLNDSEAEAAETQTWIQFSVECGYLTRETGAAIYQEYESIIAMLVSMRNQPQNWCIGNWDTRGKR